MSNEYEFEIPIDPSEIDEQALENRGPMPSGWYKAKCLDIFPDQKDDTGHKIKFEIVAGPYRGRDITDTIWNPANSDTDEKRKSATNRQLLIFHRLGARDDKSNKVNLRKPVGSEFVLHLVKQREAWCETCQEVPPRAKGDKTRKCNNCGGALKWIEKEDSFSNIDFEGVYPLDHPKIPAEERERLGLPPARTEDGEHAASVPATKKAPATTKPAASAPPKTNGSAAQSKPPASASAPKEERLSKALAGF